MKPEVIVIGKNPSIILGLVRSLGQSGYVVHVVKTTIGFSYEQKSKYISSYHIIHDANNTLVDFLLNKFAVDDNKRVIIPGDDNAATIIDQQSDKLKPHFLFPNIGYQQGRITAFMNKLVQKQLAIECGLSVPQGGIIEWEGNTYKIPSDIKYPCFVKPAAFHQKRKLLMKKCNNQEELQIVMSKCPMGLPMLVEEYVEIECEYGISGIGVNGKAKIPSLIKKSETLLGTTVSGCLSPMAANAELELNISKFISEIGFTGIFDIDLFESKGKFYFCELNLRLGNSGVATLLSGINLADYLVKSLQNIEGNTIPTEFEEKIFVDERVCVSNYLMGKMSLKRIFGILKSAEIKYVKNKLDVKPYYIFYFISLIYIIYYNIKKLIR